MIISFDSNSEQGKKLKEIFTVENKDIDRQERIMNKKLPYQRYIKLFTETKDQFYFPIGPFGRMLAWSEDKRLPEEFIYSSDETNVPRDMLIEQKSIMLEMAMDDAKTGMVVMKTGRGKGNMIMQLIQMYQQKTLILCHNRKTVIEMQEKFAKFTNYEPGLWYSSKKELKDITITTHDSFCLQQETFRNQFGLVLYDECDYNLTKDMIQAMTFCDCEGLIGFTGTPKTKALETKDLQLVFGKLYQCTQGNYGYNILPTIKRVIYKGGVVASYSSFVEMRTQMSHDVERMEAQINFIESTHSKHKMSLLLIDRVDDCAIYEAGLTSRGIPCRVIHGKTKEKQDKQSIQDMLEQNGVIIGTYHKIGRGVDIPPIDSIYFYFPNSFDSTAIQAVGRSLRSFPGKTEVTLYDWNDIPILGGQAHKRMQTYKNEYHVTADQIECIDL